jgi:DNA polymerase III subunit delta'
MRFAHTPGYETLVANLTQGVAAGRVPQAMLFTGPEGSPVVPIALGYLSYLFCEKRQKSPDARAYYSDSCGECHSCQMTGRLVHPDVHLVYPASASEGGEEKDGGAGLAKAFRAFINEQPLGSMQAWAAAYGAGNRQPIIRVPDVRQLLERLSMKAFEGGYKVAFIYLPEFMNLEGANALLKVLEEPPAETVFILASYTPERLLPTILSRVLNVRLAAPEDEAVARYLSLHTKVDTVLAQQAALAAEGNLALAIELSQNPALSYQDFFIRWMRAVYKTDYALLAKQGEEFKNMGRENQKALLSYALTITRHTLRRKLSGSGALQGMAVPELTKFMDAVPAESIEPTAKILERMYRMVEGNVAPVLMFMSSGAQLAQAMKLRSGG